MDFELSRVSHKIIEFSGLSPDDEVVIVTDSERIPIAESLMNAVLAAGFEAALTVISKTQYHGSELPNSVARSIRAADVVYAVTTHSFTHTEGYREAKANGTRISTLRGVTRDMYVDGGVNTDYERLNEITVAVRNRLSRASEARVTSHYGTDIRVDIAGNPAYVLGVIRHDLNENTGSYPPGESPILPTEGEAEGTIVIDRSMDNIGVLDEPITLLVEDGLVTDISGGVAATQLERIVDETGHSARTIAEFAIGTNPDARLSGHVVEEKKREGTVHFAIGDNRTLGGSVSCGIHLDGVLTEPSVELDGERIIDRGRLLIDQ